MNPISNPSSSIPTFQIDSPSKNKDEPFEATPGNAGRHSLLEGLPPRGKKGGHAGADAFSASDVPHISIVDTASPGADTRSSHTPASGLNHKFLSAFGTAKMLPDPGEGLGLYHDLQPLDGRHIGEERGVVFETKVTYLNARDRLGYKVSVEGGLIRANGQLMDTRDAPVRPGKTPERAIFVMDRHGNIYISKFSKKGVFHHSSFLSGQPVAAAGDIRIEKGRITDISRTSGHYQPTSKQLRQFLHRLTQLGVPDTYRVHDEASTAAST